MPDDKIVAPPVWSAGFDPKRMLAPWRLRVLESDRRMTFAAAVRVIDRVHGFTEDLRLASHPPHAAGLADGDEMMVGIADGTDGCKTLLADFAHFAAWQ